jgi:hypothetical protein
VLQLGSLFILLFREGCHTTSKKRLILVGNISFFRNIIYSLAIYFLFRAAGRAAGSALMERCMTPVMSFRNHFISSYE